MQASARAHPNIALIKYWGKRDPALNLPAAGSLSITLDRFATETSIAFGASADGFVLNGAADERAAARVFAWLDRFRDRSDPSLRARIESRNNFPTAAGLASAASGFAALALARAAALNTGDSPAELSRAARLGSGSAARSIFGGFALMRAGTEADGSDARAEPLLGPDEWPLKVAIAITTRRAKADPSGSGMEASRRTSPYFRSWIASTRVDLEGARAAVEARDFERLATLSEASCMKMHAVMLATEPALVYWNGSTVECLHRVRELRAAGTAVFYTIDAGPQLKAVCLPEAVAQVAGELAQVPGVEEVVTVGLGPGAARIPEPAPMASPG